MTVTSSGTTGFATIGSADGTIQWKFTLTGAGPTYTMVGAGVEQDTAEGGTPPPPAYSASMKGKATISGTTFTASVAVIEAATQP